MDARPKINASANAVAGAGYEVMSNYKNCEISFMGIENIHAVRASYKKVKNMCTSFDDSNFSSLLQSSDWLMHIRNILSNAVSIAQKIDEESASVLCHCSDGWDRTAQLVSLAEILLDPYYRSLKGFMVLIEKEWISFGHKFWERFGHIDPNYTDENRSPIFVQWLDCVWQIWQQFPSSFEFNEEFLLTLAENATSCQFGTFLTNCEHQRKLFKIEEKTHSLWSAILHEKEKFCNLFYDSEKAHHREIILLPDCSSGSIKFWSNLYLQFHPKWNPQVVCLGERQKYFPDKQKKVSHFLEAEKKNKELVRQVEELRLKVKELESKLKEKEERDGKGKEDEEEAKGVEEEKKLEKEQNGETQQEK
eukprot:TRINITY_DN7807_c0_g1_i1.p1 TRINITY_DN7807_c0_g1~~TRINITY_DN7807_c0_g1_i1.p1  ORF type:complete len:363 (+),score=111.29 TRINITY_DN7807_c0_g1_i1:190-1278(+)